MSAQSNEAHALFLDAVNAEWWKGVRIKGERHRPLTPGGRSRLTLFEKALDEGRAHPRLRVATPPAQDPRRLARLFPRPVKPPANAAELRAWAEKGLEMSRGALAADDLDTAQAPAGSAHYHRNSIRTQRIARFFKEARELLAQWLADRAFPASEAAPARRALRELEDVAYSGAFDFDDSDTGTYHSFKNDKPFIHYLEEVLASLPADGGDALALLPGPQQEAVRRQRAQARAHLDFLMRNKYAAHGIEELDIERSLGGMLIDRDTRAVVSEAPASRESLVPRYERLRIAPDGHPVHAGAWVYRDGTYLRLPDGNAVEVAPRHVVAEPVEPSSLTFQRTPDDLRLRQGVRFDWDGNGYVRAGKVEWVSWAGHCDIKAILESLGTTLTDDPTLTEYRSDSGDRRTYGRDLLLEMLASMLEFGSMYRRVDGGPPVPRGIHRFGGARNDARPDRIQFQGLGPGQSFRWPLTGRQDVFVVTAMEGTAGALDVERAFMRYEVDPERLDFFVNKRFQKTVEGDYNVIDVGGLRLTADALCDDVDPQTGYLRQETKAVEIDLRPGQARGRAFLGTHVKDATRREIYRVYLDHDAPAVVAELDRFEKDRGGAWRASAVPEGIVRVPLVTPLAATLSREMKRDDPEMFQALLGVALREAQNICADTDMKAEVWNGVVTHVENTRVATNADASVEHWRVKLRARFGTATLDYLMRRGADGEPTAWCALPDDGLSRPPDFLWQDFPDVGSKGVEGGAWVVNDAMLERGVVTIERDGEAPGGAYVYDEHVKSIFEMMFCALGGYPWTIVHGNKRYGFTDEGEWQDALDRMETLRVEASRARPPVA